MVRNLIDVIALTCKNDLLKCTMDDRSLSIDEEKLVNGTILNLQELRNYARVAMVDKIITSVEKENFSFYVEKIAIDAMQIAGEDRKITYDERVLLQIIKKLVFDLRKVVNNITVGTVNQSINL